MMDVKDFYGLAGNPIKYFVRVSNKRNDMNAGSPFDFLGACRPIAEAPHDDSKPSFERIQYGWIL
jgi:hypothetical protein